MALRLLIDSVRPGWCRRRFGLFAAIARIAVMVFVFHVSGAAHLLADTLLDDDMSCVDEMAHNHRDGSTVPRCPASQGIGHGQGVTPLGTGEILIPPATHHQVAELFTNDGSPPSPPTRSIERPPRA